MKTIMEIYPQYHPDQGPWNKQNQYARSFLLMGPGNGQVCGRSSLYMEMCIQLQGKEIMIKTIKNFYDKKKKTQWNSHWTILCK